MDNFNRQHNWTSNSFSFPRVSKQAPFSLPLAAQQITPLSTTPPPSSDNQKELKSSAEVDALMAKLKKKMEMGTFSPDDNQTLLHLLDQGWFAGNDVKAESMLKTAAATRNNVSRPPSSASGASASAGIPAVRPLNLASIRDTADASSSALASPTMFSTRSSIARFSVDQSLFDTPRSWATAASLASTLPQTTAELEDMELEDVERLAEEANVLQQRAATALRLAQLRLDQGGWSETKHATLLSGAAEIVLSLCIIILAVANFVLMLLEMAFKAIGRQVQIIQPERALHLIFGFIGAMVGLLQGIVNGALLHGRKYVN